MGSTVVMGATMMLATCGVALLGWLIYTVRAARLDAHEALKGIKALLAAFDKGHPYSDPSAAAVVTSPVPVPPGQLPAFARSIAAELESADLPEAPVDSTGDRSGVNPGSPVPTEARPDVVQALGAPPGMVGLSVDESDAAQAQEGQEAPPVEVDAGVVALAKVDALAKVLGLTREAMLARLVQTGLSAEERRAARSAGPTNLNGKANGKGRK